MSRTTSLLISVAVVAALSAPSLARPKHRSVVLKFAPPADPPPADPAPTDATTPAVATTTTPTPATTPAAAPAPAPADDKKPDPEAQAKKIATALDDTHSAEELRDTLPPTPWQHDTHPAPRFEIAAGGFVQSRGLDFDFDPNADGGPPSYPASQVSGFAVAAAVYPMPINKYDHKLTGIGFTFRLAKSFGSTLVASDDTGTGEYEVDHTAYDAGVHYRYPIDRFVLDGSVSYGNWSHTIVDLPDSIQIPDTSYTYLGAGAHVDIYPTERASIGFGAKYLSITSSGDVSSQDWYGAGSAGGVELEADFLIPLPANLFVRGGLEWRKIWIDFDGSGDLADQWGVATMTDTSITGSALLGVQF